jgi:hypothetical protein
MPAVGPERFIREWPNERACLHCDLSAIFNEPAGMSPGRSAGAVRFLHSFSLYHPPLPSHFLTAVHTLQYYVPLNRALFLLWCVNTYFRFKTTQRAARHDLIHKHPALSTAPPACVPPTLALFSIKSIFQTIMMHIALLWNLDANIPVDPPIQHNYKNDHQFPLIGSCYGTKMWTPDRCLSS